jgi:hypothetical protein
MPFKQSFSLNNNPFLAGVNPLLARVYDPCLALQKQSYLP